MTRAAVVGLRAHSGWAALVAIARSPGGPEVVDRRRVVLADPRVAGSLQPYHAAAERGLAKGAALVSDLQARARRLAQQGLASVKKELEDRGYALVGATVLLAAGRPLLDLETTLSSHALIHTADGEHFRDALVGASADCKIPVSRIRERDLLRTAETSLGMSASALQAIVASLGRALGPPWTQDQKLAALAAWVALATSSPDAPEPGRNARTTSPAAAPSRRRVPTRRR
jgi:hypothetical protein